MFLSFGLKMGYLSYFQNELKYFVFKIKIVIF